MIEEKVVNKETGEITYRKYLKGKFLGKVGNKNSCINFAREDLPNALSSQV